MRNECEFQFFDLDPTFESNLTLEPKPDLSYIPELVLVLEHITLEPKSTTPPSNIPLWENDCRLEFQFLDLDPLLDPCLLYTSPSPRDRQKSRMPSSA